MSHQSSPKPNQCVKRIGDREVVTFFSVLLFTVLGTPAIAAKALEREGSYVLVLKPESGGSTLTTRNLFFGSRTRPSGGAIVHYHAATSYRQKATAGI
ncbi:hypothetical protein [Leptolyngbya sp. NIES-2104]|uniref:hypothetical protein n=1 Tax=Leptolyngbya sp. NIES-2104 TaxID=1552121 RepID=UPI0006EC9306|nr:hypothetical protein [Leptolyngbya sp. NIES-2104]GAP94109.1 hypothetical protein NIES2104_06190 [Leptolyngbya sp. NIES-2104]